MNLPDQTILKAVARVDAINEAWHSMRNAERDAWRAMDQCDEASWTDIGPEDYAALLAERDAAFAHYDGLSADWFDKIMGLQTGDEALALLHGRRIDG